MELAFWICSSFLLLSVVIYFLSYIKYNFVVNSISGVLFVPLLTAIFILQLIKYLPDSFHMLTLGSLALIFYSISEIFLIFEKKKILSLLSRLSIYVSIGLWCYCYYSTFLIYNHSDFTFVFFLILLFICFSASLFFIDKKNISSILQTAILLTQSIFLLFSSFVTFFYEKSISSILLLIGSILILTNSALFIVNQKKRLHHEKLIHTFLSLFSQTAISFATILIFAGI
jgi:hypothetical protein